MVKKVLVIGGTGAQGAHVVKSLVEDGAYSVRVLTRDIHIITTFLFHSSFIPLLSFISSYSSFTSQSAFIFR